MVSEGNNKEGIRGKQQRGYLRETIKRVSEGNNKEDV